MEIRLVTENSPGGYIHLGYAGGIFIDGEPYHPYDHLGGADGIREAILKAYDKKNK